MPYRQIVAFAAIALLAAAPLNAAPLVRSGEVVVRLKEPAKSLTQARQLSSFQGIGEVARLAGKHYALVQLSGERQGVISEHRSSADSACATLKKRGAVTKCSPNFVYKASATPDDTHYSSLYGLQRINAPAAWDTTTGSNSVVVAVIDTGIDYTHPDLVDNLWRNSGEVAGNNLDDDGNGYVDDVYGVNTITGSGSPLDDNGHGTHVAGTIGAVGNNGRGVTGVAWNVKLMALKFLAASGSGSTLDAIEAVEYAAAHGADVINASWGGADYSEALEDAIRSARILFVAAAGNESTDNDASPSYPSNYALSNVITVAASKSDNSLASQFSNYGASSVHLAAPGVTIGSTYLNGQYANLSGTSMAAPHVTGVAALMLSVNNSLSGTTLTRILKETVTVHESLAEKVSTRGIVNAEAAVAAAQSATNDPEPPSDDDGGGGDGGSGGDPDEQDGDYTVTVGSYNDATGDFLEDGTIRDDCLLFIERVGGESDQVLSLQLNVKGSLCQVGELEMAPGDINILSCKAVKGYRGRATFQLTESDGTLVGSSVARFAPAKSRSRQTLTKAKACRKLARQVHD